MINSRLPACTLLFAAGALIASASLISLGPITLPTAVSSLPTVLTIQNAGTASGCVGFIAGMDVTGLAACPGGFVAAGGNEIGDSTKTGTRTIAELNAAGVESADKLLLVFHSGEPGGGPIITIEDLALTFFDVTNDITFTASLPGLPMALDSTAPGASNNTGFAFGLDEFETGLAAEFFSNPQNRIGAAATLTGSAGGIDTFALTSPPAAVPEPGTLLGISSGLLLIAVVRVKQRRRKVTRPRF